MAVTVTPSEIVPRERVGRMYRTRYKLTLSGTYATGGFAVTASNVGLSQLKDLEPGTCRNGTEFMVTEWDQANSKIMLGWTGGAISSELDEITNGDTVTSFVVDVTAYGF